MDGTAARPCRAYLTAMSSITGQLFRVSTFGESHGPAVGVTVDGCPPLLEVSIEAIQHDLDRRRPGQSKLVTQRQETDQVEVLSGVLDGITTGAPIAMIVRNADHRSGAYDHLSQVYRPSHADFTFDQKYGIRHIAGGGRSSARETIGRVAAAAIARALLAKAANIEVLGWVSAVHDVDATDAIDIESISLQDVENDPTRCPSSEHAERMTSAIEQARKDGDSLGGVVTCIARHVPPGLGEPVFDKLDAELAKAIMSLPACKGVEIGSGFQGTAMTGRSHNDPFIRRPDGSIGTSTNHSGGIQGGISNGETIVVRAAFKPTATISSRQHTVTTSGEPTELEAKGRHDPCVLPRAVPLVEAAVLLTLADHYLRQHAIRALW